MTKFIDVIVPGLFQLPLAELDKNFLSRELPSLNQVLRFARSKESPLQDYDAIFADSLGLPQYSTLPFAAALAKENEPPSQILLFQAVHLKPDMRNAFVVPLEQSNRTREDIIIVINDLLELFKDDCDITLRPDGLCLMRLKHCQAVDRLPPVLSVIGRKVDPYIKQSRQALPWYQLINEMQMFMHSHEVNQRRLVDGLPAINSLWCWGAGEFIEPPNPDMQCYCDDSMLIAYAKKGRLGLHSLSEISRSEFARENICIDLSLLQALKLSTEDDLQILLTRLETKLFDPLVKAVRRGQLQLRLRAGHGYDYSLSRLSLLKRWRGPGNLMSVLT